ncbi:hypothetical protein JOD54_006272 [Actinokineospora baliensis]|uniref:hypothetical protein n=1 Tax=Actinokineospora baliensis TaxID=547056 RepID=UPI00195E0147|nr:hypothetical protein [Actinokineospora baliensis]MBM7776068.1 hypothetical protein [Actinokineospora baliensis]
MAFTFRTALATLSLGAALVTTTALVAAPAQASTTETHRVCQTVLAPLAPGEQASKVLSKRCFDEPVAARAQRQPLPDELLVTFYEEAGQTGDESEVYGGDTCDSEGYGISDMDDVQDEADGVSSYTLFGDCDVSEKFSDYDFEGTSSGLIFGQNQSWVGAEWNDGGIKSFSLHS